MLANQNQHTQLSVLAVFIFWFQITSCYLAEMRGCPQEEQGGQELPRALCAAWGPPSPGGGSWLSNPRCAPFSFPLVIQRGGSVPSPPLQPWLKSRSGCSLLTHRSLTPLLISSCSPAVTQGSTKPLSRTQHASKGFIMSFPEQECSLKCLLVVLVMVLQS